MNKAVSRRSLLGKVGAAVAGLLAAPAAKAAKAVVQKIMSAQRAAHSRPRGEEPACRIIGRPCGLRGIDIGPRVRT